MTERMTKLSPSDADEISRLRKRGGEKNRRCPAQVPPAAKHCLPQGGRIQRYPGQKFAASGLTPPSNSSQGPIMWLSPQPAGGSQFDSAKPPSPSWPKLIRAFNLLRDLSLAVGPGRAIHNTTSVQCQAISCQHEENILTAHIWVEQTIAHGIWKRSTRPADI